MALISRRGQGRRINNTRTRVLLRRMCVKSADLTAHSPPKTFARPRTATRPSRALPLPHATPTHARRLRDAFPADRIPHSPPKTFARPAQRHALPEHFCSPTQRRHTPTQCRRTPAGCAMHSPQPSQLIPRRRPSLAPAQRHARPEHFHSPTQPRRTPAGCAMHSPLPSQPIPRRRPSLAPHSDTPSQTLLLAHAAQMHARRPHDPFPAEELRPSPQRHAASPSVPLRAQKKRHRTVDVRCRMSRSTVVAVGHWGW